MLIAGAGNLGLHTLDQLLSEGYEKEIVFFDEKGKLPALIDGKYRVIGRFEELPAYFKQNGPEFITTVGQSRIREKLHQKLLEYGGSPVNVISSKACFISQFSDYGTASIIQPGCAVSHNVRFGKGCVLHAATLIGHDIIFGDFVTIGSNVNILKGVNIGNYSTISPNVLVYQNIRIGHHCYIAPGVVVTADVEDYSTLSL